MSRKIFTSLLILKQRTLVLSLVSCVSILSCTQKKESIKKDPLEFSHNILDYHISPKDSLDKSGLMFSDQGAWFAYSLPKKESHKIGFSGPFLMTQQNGIWSSPNLSVFNFTIDNHEQPLLDFNEDLKSQNSYASHLEQLFENKNVVVKQDLVFMSGHTALQRVKITNISNTQIVINTNIKGSLSDIGIRLSKKNNTVSLHSEKSKAIGHILVKNNIEHIDILDENSLYSIQLKTINLQPNTSNEIIISHSFIFPEYSWNNEKNKILNTNFDTVLNSKKVEKKAQIKSLLTNRRPQFKKEKYARVLAKAHLTLQNNWRIPAGAIKHEGLFPSYHYKWFNGFWSWDSWKHAVGLSYFNPDLAKKQIRLMFEFQDDDGFVADCVFRDTLIEKHNYRDTKPPLSAWAVSKIFEKDKDLSFIKVLYPKLKKYHYWWYQKRDHDNDGLCEYGSTDGSLIAAKWESGMDNAIRFDHSEILKNSENAYSLNQESVDLNAYLYAEKHYLAQLASALKMPEDATQFQLEAKQLRGKIQSQFYDEKDGWFYDTNLEGTAFIKGEGSEGWTMLWANAATNKQASAVKNKMMNPKKFFTKVPFQTMSADHQKFDPLNGYWRGPNWLDQAYFGVKALRNYGFNEEANNATIQILEGAEGLLDQGPSIRENYHPLTGKGLHAQNFSWSAAHIIMLLLKN
ncbi:trehalase family glycosidase [uncultured Psychroserpens sp.]|uniref:MGH1-like glycoside hydrolase domain-containing protein n=1 Tax=uncultured Psychroserpens sp. TaxID=255436 RepID=UPI0026032203|nr:trehalase family glycosidase [uncultured Psychroserpens sp.]